MKIWLDDNRDPDSAVSGVRAQRYMRGRPDEDCQGWIWVKTAPDAIELLKTAEVEEISLDHDLGPDIPSIGSGNDVLAWLEEATFINDDYWPPIIHVHSGNQSARTKMDHGVTGIERRLALRGEEAPPPGPRRPPTIMPTGKVFE